MPALLTGYVPATLTEIRTALVLWIRVDSVILLGLTFLLPDYMLPDQTHSEDFLSQLGLAHTAVLRQIASLGDVSQKT